MDIEMINQTIEELEKGATSYNNCSRLASLYIVRENLNKEIKYSDNLIKTYCKYIKNGDVSCLASFIEELKKKFNEIELNGSQEEKDVINTFISSQSTSTNNLEIRR